MAQKIRAVLDTNIFISALIHPGGVPGQIISAFKASKFVLCTSEIINREIISVLNRPRIRDRYKITEDVIFDVGFILWRMTEIIIGASDEVKVSKDPDDNKFLSCAAHGKVDYLVTGDMDDLLSLGEFQGVHIINPRQFLDLLNQT